MRLFFIFFLFGVTGAKDHTHGHGHHSGGVPSTSDVDQALHDIDRHYNENLCLEILLIDCAKHTMTGDEQVCGTNGITYDSHCKFAHAKCEFIHSDVNINVANHGPCTATASATTIVSATDAKTATVPLPGITTTTTTGVPTSPTPDPAYQLIHDVFCRNVNTVNCLDTFSIVCGSDGQLYPNECELAKAKCTDTSLYVVNRADCSYGASTTAPAP